MSSSLLPRTSTKLIPTSTAGRFPAPARSRADLILCPAGAAGGRPCLRGGTIRARGSALCGGTAAGGGFSGADFLVVPDVLTHLQEMAARRRSEADTPVVIGITGSNGKTIVKEWLYRLLVGWTEVVRSPRSYFSRIGVPLSVWQLRPEHRIGIFEVGIDRGGEMDLLAAVIQPTHGILTSLGESAPGGLCERGGEIGGKTAAVRRMHDDTGTRPGGGGLPATDDFTIRPANLRPRRGDSGRLDLRANRARPTAAHRTDGHGASLLPTLPQPHRRL